jgi:DNA-directed RNA polymerase specialized sigma24 family protein
MRERERLIDRIRQLRRVAADTETASAPAVHADPDPARLQALERRLNELEQLVQGLQDSVHRESRRLSKRIAELEAITQPAALRAALSKDARERGL